MARRGAGRGRLRLLQQIGWHRLLEPMLRHLRLLLGKPGGRKALCPEVRLLLRIGIEHVVTGMQCRLLSVMSDHIDVVCLHVHVHVHGLMRLKRHGKHAQQSTATRMNDAPSLFL